MEFQAVPVGQPGCRTQFQAMGTPRALLTPTGHRTGIISKSQQNFCSQSAENEEAQTKLSSASPGCNTRPHFPSVFVSISMNPAFISDTTCFALMKILILAFCWSRSLQRAKGMAGRLKNNYLNQRAEENDAQKCRKRQLHSRCGRCELKGTPWLNLGWIIVQMMVGKVSCLLLCTQHCWGF